MLKRSKHSRREATLFFTSAKLHATPVDVASVWLLDGQLQKLSLHGLLVGYSLVVNV